MKTTRNAVISIAALAIAGCGGIVPRGHGHQQGAKTTCNDRVCQVRLSVTEACIITAGDVSIISNEPLVKITWHVSGGEFTPNGIVIKSGPPGHFSPPVHHGQTFTYDFRNSPKVNTWKFDVNVKVGSKVCETFDPYVMN
jgi:hypothetical protein